MGDKENLQRYLIRERDGLVGKLDGLSEYDVRRPLTPTGTSLLGLVKHVAFVQLGYLTLVFGRPVDWPGYAQDGRSDDDDLWVTADETREQILDYFRHSSAKADETIAALDLDAPGFVPWWGTQGERVTLQRVLVHLIAEIARHAGHADILREGLDGAAGRWAGDPSLQERTPEKWAAYRATVEAAARRAGDVTP
ncbi:MAG: DinB family protein [Micrococcales bacterium]|nr:DinB family protein [Micrococcales bacterium]